MIYVPNIYVQNQNRTEIIRFEKTNKTKVF